MNREDTLTAINLSDWMRRMATSPLFTIRYSIAGLMLEAERRVYGPHVYVIAG